MKQINIILLVFFIISTLSSANSQETIKVRKKNGKDVVEIFEVLKENKSIKHGFYQRFYKKNISEECYYKNGEKDSLSIIYGFSGNILIKSYYKRDQNHGAYTSYNPSGLKDREGFYKDLCRDSTWIIYSPSGVPSYKETYYKCYKTGPYTMYYSDGKTIRYTGEYYRDKRSGIWDFFNFDGTLDQKYNYDNNEIIYVEKQENQQVTIYTDSSVITKNVETMGMYIGGFQELMWQIQSNIKIPDAALYNEINGTVIISFILEKNGTLSNIEVVKGLGFGLDEESIKALKSVPNNWIPFIFDGKPAAIKFRIPIKFKLSR